MSTFSLMDKAALPFTHASRQSQAADTVVSVGTASFGGGHFGLIAGPCSVENHDQMLELARNLKEMGVSALRGGTFKPRSSPYSFQGLGSEALGILAEAGRETGLPVVSEITGIRQLDDFAKADISMLQIGSRNMHNYELLKEVARFGRPVLLKRHFAAPIEEFLLSAEYLLNEGNPNVILCERGVRSFDPAYRNVLDLNGLALIKELSHLPVIVDPSHASGRRDLVPSLACAATAAGCDGLMIEVHPQPDLALSDALQQISPAVLGEIMPKLKKMVGNSV